MNNPEIQKDYTGRKFISDHWCYAPNIDGSCGCRKRSNDHNHFWFLLIGVICGAVAFYGLIQIWCWII